MKDILKLGVTLFAICAVAALVLGVTNNITAPVIEERNIQASNEARKTVLPEADEFKELEGMNSDIVLEVYEGIKDGQVIARAHNLKETKLDTTNHAEILAIQKASKKLKSWRLIGCEMYVTLEPCSMCAGALINSRIKKVYIGASDEKTGAVGSVFNLLEDYTFNHKVEYEKGILQEDCENLLKQFFKELRKMKK